MLEYLHINIIQVQLLELLAKSKYISLVPKVINSNNYLKYQRKNHIEKFQPRLIR